MRIVIDGTVGAGKTTVLKGFSQRDFLKRRFCGFADLGYPVFGDLIINVIAEMRSEGYADPMEDWSLFFKKATELGICYYKRAESTTINFYDRGLYYLEIMAKRYCQRLPDMYYDFCASQKYDEPIFIFEPITNLDMTHPHEEDNRQKVYTLDERLQQQCQVLNIYRKYGYKYVLTVPVYSDDIATSIALRIKKIKGVLKI